jgi:3-oxoacyl-[acyl-carrier protein] reductase
MERVPKSLADISGHVPQSNRKCKYAEVTMGKLDGKVAIVTGAGRGIGSHVARKLAAEGAQIVAIYSDSRGGVDALLTEIGSKQNNSYHFQLDLRDTSNIKSLFKRIDEEKGRVDILINCAAISCMGGLSDIVDEDSVLDVLSVNVLAPFYLARESVKRMVNGGRIVNFSSSSVHHTLMNSLGIYAATKSAVESLTNSWSRELAPKGITVNSVVPGPTSPGLMENAGPEATKFFLNHSPAGRIGHADEVASVVEFLCSPEASWVSGTHIMVNGASNC